MKKLILCSASIILIACNSSKQPVDYVDPMIGTGFHGHTYPGATLPNGAVQLSPDTHCGDWDSAAGYHYDDSTMLGFSHTHLSGTGCIDLGDILFYPSVDGKLYEPLAFSHKNEKAEAGYYSVKLDNGIYVELTATTHIGLHRYSFPSDGATIAIDLKHTLDFSADVVQSSFVEHTSDREIIGGRVTNGWTQKQNIYFVAQFSEPFSSTEIKDDESILKFSARNVEVKVGISIVSVENARLNLEAQAANKTFEDIRAEARNVWNDKLSAYSIEGGTEEQLINFYSALYHTMIVPNIVSDVNGDYRGADDEIHTSSTPIYNTFSLWDTFRAWNPLQTLTNEKLVIDMINSYLNFYDQYGQLPIWSLSSGETECMIGYHAVSVIWDAYNKGIRNFDATKALEAMKKTAQINSKATTPFLALGYIPAESKRESVSRLLENCYDDWCIAQMADALGYADDYQEYIKRSQLYANVFDGSTSFFRGKSSDGTWEAAFDPFDVGRAYTEATAWQYRYFVPHDVKGLENLLGGRELMRKALDTLFTVSSDLKGHMSDITGLIGQYAHGNEPSHHIIYLYNYVGQPWKTQYWSRRLLDEMYQPTPSGISGNEDCGQMSAWYVMSAMGLYAVCPGTNQYALTTPLFDKLSVKLGNGKVLDIVANGADKSRYIKSVKFNGSVVEDNFICHADLMLGGDLVFELSDEPVLTRGASEDASAYSFTTTTQVSVPYFKGDLSLFNNETQVEMGTTTPGATIYYTIDGSVPTVQSARYEKPIVLTATTKLRAIAVKDGAEPSRIAEVRATLATPVKSLSVNPIKNGTNYQYYKGKFASVAQMLSDGVKGANGVMNEPSIANAEDEDHYGYTFEGYINIPQTGIYTFYTKTDDGSVLEINGQTVVDNDGSHAAIKATGRIVLEKGFHAYRLLYFEDWEGQHLEWGWITPTGTSDQKISKESLFIK